MGARSPGACISSQLPPASVDVTRRIGDPRGREASAAEAARIAHAAGASLRVRLVAGHREREVDAQLATAPDDLRLARLHERRVYGEARAFDPRLRREPGEPFEGRDVL